MRKNKNPNNPTGPDKEPPRLPGNKPEERTFLGLPDPEILLGNISDMLSPDSLLQDIPAAPPKDPFNLAKRPPLPRVDVKKLFYLKREKSHKTSQKPLFSPAPAPVREEAPVEDNVIIRFPQKSAFDSTLETPPPQESVEKKEVQTRRPRTPKPPATVSDAAPSAEKPQEVAPPVKSAKKKPAPQPQEAAPGNLAVKSREEYEKKLREREKTLKDLLESDKGNISSSSV